MSSSESAVTFTLPLARTVPPLPTAAETFLSYTIVTTVAPKPTLPLTLRPPAKLYRCDSSSASTEASASSPVFVSVSSAPLKPATIVVSSPTAALTVLDITSDWTMPVTAAFIPPLPLTDSIRMSLCALALTIAPRRRSSREGILYPPVPPFVQAHAVICTRSPTSVMTRFFTAMVLIAAPTAVSLPRETAPAAS